jgi:hypothetical protein
MRYGRPPILASIVAVGALALLAAGCGGGGSPGVANVPSSTVPRAAGSSAATNSRTSALLLAGRCLRQHGLSNLPDPAIATSGPAKGQPVLDKQAMHAFPDSVVSQATLACAAVLQYAGIGGGSSARTPQQIQDGLAFSRCVRNHGIANFPDPNGQGTFNLAGTGINSHDLTPAQLAAAQACLSAAHGAVHIPQQGTGTSNSGG